MALDKEYFKMQISRLSNISSPIKEDVALKEYYPKFEGLSQTRFAEVVEYLLNTWHFNTFPKPADFNDANRLTYKEPSYQPMKRENDNTATNPEMIRIDRAFKIMDIIRGQVCKPIVGGDYNQYPSKTYPIMRKFYRNMVEKGMVFSVENKSWIVKSNALGSGEYFNPAEWGNW